MGKVRIRRLTVEAFRGYVDHQSTPLLPPSGLYGIRGFNNDTGGSSAAGKSGVGYAICFALGILPPKFTASKLRSNKTKKPMQVDLEMDSDAGPVTLRRGKITSIKVGDEAEISGSVDAVNARLYRLLGLSEDMLRALVFRQQKKPGLFLAMKDSAKKEFLGQLLGLLEIEDSIELAVTASNKFKVEADKLETVRAALEQELRHPTSPVCENTNEAHVRLAEAQASSVIIRAALDQARGSLAAFQAQSELESEALHAKLKEEAVVFGEAQLQRRSKRAPKPTRAESPLVAQFNGALQDCKNRVAAEELRVRTLRSVLHAQLHEVTKEVAERHQFIRRQDDIAKQLLQVENNIRTAEQEECPTCEQPWSATASKLEEWKARQKACLTVLDAIKISKESLPGLAADVSRLTAEIAALEADPGIAQLRSVQSQLEQRLTAEKAAAGSDLALYDARIAAEEQELRSEKSAFDLAQAQSWDRFINRVKLETESLKALVAREQYSANENSNVVSRIQYEISHIEQRNKLEQERWSREKDHYDALNLRIGNLVQQINQNLEGFHKEADFASTLKTFLGSIFDEVLNEIAAEANELLLALPNVATTVLSFASDKVSDSGSIKKEIRPVLNQGGEEVDLEVFLSGGQGTAVELAVDLALNAVITRRLGVSPGFAIMDETFDGLDQVVKESCFEILQKAADDKLILVITHAEAFKDYLSGVLQIESTNGISRIVEAQ